MEEGITKPSIFIIADNFTGTNDAGVSLAQVGHTADVAFEMHYCGDVSVWMINSDSRAMDLRLAAMKITSLMSHPPLVNNSLPMIKGIGSMPRGNIGAEIEALMEACGIMGAVVALAFPQAGRIIMAGEYWVNGVWITETEFANDPKTPALSARTADIIRLQTAAPCQPVTVSQLNHLSHEQLQIGVIDTQTDNGLDRIAAAVMQVKQPLLLVGSASVCDAVARRSAVMSPPIVLTIVDSMSEIAQWQIVTPHSHLRITQIYIDIERILAGNASDYDARIMQTLQKGGHCTIHICNDSVAGHQTDTLCRRWQMGHVAPGEKTCRSLGELARQTLLCTMPDALHLSGGDVVMATASTLDATGSYITGKVAQCVPYGCSLGGIRPHSVMTKVGEFGDETTLCQVLNFIKEKCNE